MPIIAKQPDLQNPPIQRTSYCIKAGSYTIDLNQQTKIMGVINMTPDSFSQDGCLDNPDVALRIAEQFIQDGADILDIGGESSRPGAVPISDQEEIQRVIPIIKKLASNINIPISVDTYKPRVAKQALDAGASIINVIKGTQVDAELLNMVKSYNAGIVLMHMQGTPQNMQENIHYTHLIEEVFNSLQNAIEKCLEIGIKSDKIIIDPGIGFGKTVDHNLKLLNHLSDFQDLCKPILVGTSRKSFIGKVLNKNVEDRLIGTIATVCASIINGAHIVRVHDVKTAKDAATMIDAITGAQ